MNSARCARASGARDGGAKPTASKPSASACARIADLISALMAIYSLSPRGEGWGEGPPRRRSPSPPHPGPLPKGRGNKASPAATASDSSPPAIGCHALIGQPQALGWRAGLIEHVDRHAAARIPVAADAQPVGCDRLDHAPRDGQGAVLVE